MPFISWFWLLLLLPLLFHAIPMFVAVRVVSVSCLQASHKIMYFFFRSFRPFVQLEAHEASLKISTLHACMRVCSVCLFVCWLFTVHTLNRRWLYLFLSAYARMAMVNAYTHRSTRSFYLARNELLNVHIPRICVRAVWDFMLVLSNAERACFFLSVVMVRMREGNFDTGWTTAHDNCHLYEHWTIGTQIHIGISTWIWVSAAKIVQFDIRSERRGKHLYRNTI